MLKSIQNMIRIPELRTKLELDVNAAANATRKLTT